MHSDEREQVYMSAGEVIKWAAGEGDDFWRYYMDNDGRIQTNVGSGVNDPIASSRRQVWTIRVPSSQVLRSSCPPAGR